mmetsp:Transcript_22680/g.44509  ORF Transcript_22680/g.44509 Transcript_22680/m.44509 type:complete len:100 (-) Transcript_22680:338-637(-)
MMDALVCSLWVFSVGTRSRRGQRRDQRCARSRCTTAIDLDFKSAAIQKSPSKDADLACSVVPVIILCIRSFPAESKTTKRLLTRVPHGCPFRVDISERL